MNDETVQKKRVYDLEDRTFTFADRVGKFLKQIPKSARNVEYSTQLIRSSGSIAANYIEANESLGKGDFAMRLKICRKESKESRLWLRLIDLSSNPSLETERMALAQEAQELTFIFAAILRKAKAIQ